MKKYLGILFVALLTFALVGCVITNSSEQSTTKGNDQSTTEQKPTDSTQPGSDTVSSQDTSSNQQSSDQPSSVKPVDPNATYTLKDFLESTTSLNWNPLTWETNDDSAILAYVSMGFYDYWVNDTKDGYVVVPEMAAEMATDVTAQYVGRFGVVEGETNKAFRIPLNRAATWQDGTQIKADDYIYSMQQQLDPEQLNRRADSYYGGDFSIVNAKNYLYSGKKAWFASETVFEHYSADLDSQLVFQWGFDADVYSHFMETMNGYKSHIDNGSYGEAGSIVGFCNGAFSAGLTVTDADCAALDGKTLAEIKADETMKAVWDALIGFWQTDPDEEFHFFIAEKTFDVVPFSEVGLVKVDDYTIDIIIEKELENPNFYVPYYLSSTWLVQESAYEADWSTDATGKRINLYNSNVETTVSYGPYKMTYFEADKAIKFAKNDNWYGWTDGKHEGKYQTTNIEYSVIANHETALLAFFKGEIDGVGMQSEDLDLYGNSKYLLYTPQSYTTKLTFNTDLAKLTARETEGINKKVMTVKEFREAFSYSLDRAYFASAFTAAGAPGFGLINYMYMYFNNEGTTEAYRESDAAKEALVRLNGIAYGGEDDDFEDLDEAYEAITGYNMAKAKAKMQEAYEYAKANNLYTDGETVEIQISVYNSDTIYQNMYEYLKGQVEEAARGTSFEGKVTMRMVADADYYESLYAGNTDMVFSTWGGATYGTLGLLSRVYCDDYTGEGNQMEVGFNTDAITVKFTIDGEEYSYSLKKWADWLNNEPLANLPASNKVDINVRIALLAELEYTYLSYYTAIPMYYRQSASLYAAKLNYAAPDSYIDLVGHGGISQITYNYTDAEWDALIAQNSGNLENLYK